MENLSSSIRPAFMVTMKQSEYRPKPPDPDLMNYYFSSLAISRMFGGFPATFFDEYHKHKPKSSPVDEYDQRITLYELYHYLNHTVLFGSGYLEPSKKRIKVLLKFADDRKV